MEKPFIIVLLSESIDVNISDNSYVVPKPLVRAVEELGDIGKATVSVLRDMGADNDLTYDGRQKMPCLVVLWVCHESGVTNSNHSNS